MPTTATLSKTKAVARPKFKYQRFPLTTMNVDESFAVRYTDKAGEVRARCDIGSAIFNLRRRGMLEGKKFTVRKREGREIRCWRIA